MDHSLLDGLTQVGAGGLIALLIVREVLGFLKGKRDGNGSGGGDALKNELRHTVVNAVNPLISAQAETLRDIKDMHHKSLDTLNGIHSGISELVDISRRTRSAGGK